MGHYEKRGDVEEWVWDDPKPEKKNTTSTASEVVKPKRKTVRKTTKAAKK